MSAQKVFPGYKRETKKRKPGGGRKPKESTILKRRLIENKMEEAEASFAFLVEVRDNPKEPIAQRMSAALAILDRVLGKPKEKHEIDAKLNGALEVKSIDYAASIAPLKAGPMDNRESSGET